MSKSIPTNLSIMFNALILQERDNLSRLVCLYVDTYFTGISVHIDLATFFISGFHNRPIPFEVPKTNNNSSA